MCAYFGIQFNIFIPYEHTGRCVDFINSQFDGYLPLMIFPTLIFFIFICFFFLLFIFIALAYILEYSASFYDQFFFCFQRQK